jgi:hypothetical protein
MMVASKGEVEVSAAAQNEEEEEDIVDVEIGNKVKINGNRGPKSR